MALDVFKIQGSVEIDGNKAKKELNEVNSHAKTIASKLGSTFQGIGQSFQKIGKAVTVGTTVAIGGLASLTKSAVTAYAEYEQLLGGVETLFKDSGDKVLAYAKEAYKKQGMSANQYMETVTSFSASLLQSLGGDTAKATEYANRAVTDMSDNANKMGTDISMIQNAYQGFAKQNYTMLDNLKLGYGGTKTEMERLIKDASKMKDVQKELNVTVDEGDLSFGNIVNAISVVQSEMGIMGTTAKEAEGTISGSLSALKGAWENLLIGMADDEQDFEELFNKLLDSLETFGKNLMPRIEIIVTTALKKILEGIKSLSDELPPVFGKIIDKIIELTESFRELDTEQKKQVLSWVALAAAAGPIITIVGKLIDGFGKFVPWIVKAVEWIGGLGGGGATAGGLTGAISGLVSACGGLAPFLGIVAAVLVGLIATIKIVKEHWDKLSSAFKEFAENIGLTKMLEDLKNRFGQLWEKLKGLEDLFNLIGYICSITLVPMFHLLVAALNVLLSVLDPLLQILGGFLDILGAIGSFIIGVFTGDLKKCGDAFKKLFDGIGNIVGGLFNLIFKPIKAVIDGIVGYFKWLFDILVGHSIVPDLIDAIVKCFKSLLGAPIKFVKNMVGKVGDFFGNLYSKTKEKFSAIGSTISDKLSQAKTKATNAFSQMVSSAKSKLSNLGSTVSSKFSSISTKIGDAMSKAKNKVSEMLSKMKTSFANFTAKIKLPHFKIKNASINPKDWITKGAPKLAVEWYAKGGVFDEPTIFNTASGLKGVGEAGPEAVAPISTLQGYVQEAVQVQNAGLEDKLNTLANILLKYLPSLESRSLVLDTGVLVGELTPKFDKSLGELTQKKIRGR